MSKGFRTTLKRLMPKKVWPLLRWIDKQLIYCLYICLWVRRSIFYPRIPVCARGVDSQTISTFSITLDYDIHKSDNFFSQLKKQGYNVFEGRHSIYLGVPDDIERFCPGLLKRYPKSAGLKIIKSLERSKDLTPFYTSRRIARASTWFSMRAVGSMLEKMTVSNLLHLEGVAPRVYDIVQLKTNDGVCHYAFVVEHVQGKVLMGSLASEFMKIFKTALDVNGMETISIKEHRDLSPPEYNRNIVSGGGMTCYVDIQNFVLSDRGQVAKIIIENRKYLWSREMYQTIIKKIEKAGISFFDKKILLVGNYSSGLLLDVLSNGAEWSSVVLQDENLLESYERVQYLYGMSRFDLLSMAKISDQSWADLLFSEYDFICLDINASAMYKNIVNQVSTSTYLLFLGEKRDELKSCQQDIMELTLSEIFLEDILSLDSDKKVVSFCKVNV